MQYKTTTNRAKHSKIHKKW